MRIFQVKYIGFPAHKAAPARPGWEGGTWFWFRQQGTSHLAVSPIRGSGVQFSDDGGTLSFNYDEVAQRMAAEGISKGTIAVEVTDAICQDPYRTGIRTESNFFIPKSGKLYSFNVTTSVISEVGDIPPENYTPSNITVYIKRAPPAAKYWDLTFRCMNTQGNVSYYGPTAPIGEPIKMQLAQSLSWVVGFDQSMTWLSPFPHSVGESALSYHPPNTLQLSGALKDGGIYDLDDQMGIIAERIVPTPTPEPEPEPTPTPEPEPTPTPTPSPTPSNKGLAILALVVILALAGGK